MTGEIIRFPSQLIPIPRASLRTNVEGRGRRRGYGGTPVAVTVNAPHADAAVVAWLSTTR
jgi:hypothetical protein